MNLKKILLTLAILNFAQINCADEKEFIESIAKDTYFTDLPGYGPLLVKKSGEDIDQNTNDSDIYVRFKFIRVGLPTTLPENILLLHISNFKNADGSFKKHADIIDIVHNNSSANLEITNYFIEKLIKSYESIKGLSKEQSNNLCSSCTIL